MKSADYKQLKNKIEDQYKQATEFAEKQRIEGLTAIDTVWKMLHKPRRQKQYAEVKLQQVESTSETMPAKPKRIYGVLADTVKKSFDYVPPEKFTCRYVLVATEKMSGHKFNYSSVSNCLKRFATDGIIEITHQGHGKSPSVYRLIKNQESVLTE